MANAGPKTGASNRPLVEHDLPTGGGDRVSAWIEQFVVVPKGAGAGKPMSLRPWQRDLISSAFDEPRPRLGLWSLPRGQGKSSLAAALGLYATHGDGVMGAQVCVVARDERQASLIFRTAVRMTELNPLLAKRSYVYTDRIYVPGSGSTLQMYPADPRSLEGLDPSLALIDEIGVVDRATFEVMLDASGKRPTSLTLCIGTPSEHGTDSVMYDLRRDMLENPDDPLTTFTEFAAPAGCALDDEEAWAVANPALHDFLFPDALRASLPPKTREARFRRARLGQWTSGADDSYMPPGLWPSRSTGVPIPKDAEVVLALDGSFSQDSTGLVAATISAAPHIDVAGHWANPGDEDWRVDVLAVEDAIRLACSKWRVKEITADPYRWQRTLQVLAKEGLPVTEFPQSAARMSPATIGLHEAALNGQVTHSGEKALAAHVANARVTEDVRGTRLRKDSKNSTHRIDLAVCAVMAWSRATFHASKKKRSKVAVW
ncbi:terminase TerL endonuclease subunit [Sporichthya polymorpha]|uniref:terminase TerL endonuclease subunit n=1 Tax=Sporichthya polymorpha TaxID=35751 RepID=UPI00036C93C5|nr:terminase TerL endonuclease subunit [Sporichthya polymorpha]